MGGRERLLMRYLFALWKPNGQAPAWSNEYSPLQADRLARCIRKHDTTAEVVCVTDYERSDFEEEIECHPFLYERRDWSSMMELYRPEIVQERAIYMGLDTVVTGDLYPLGSFVDMTGLCHIMPTDPYHFPEPCNGVVGVNHETAQAIWFSYAADAAQGALEDPVYRMFGRFSEMLWLRQNAKSTARWDELLPGMVQSYKVDLERGEITDKTRVVYFHGRPKPTQIKRDWITEAWA